MAGQSTETGVISVEGVEFNVPLAVQRLRRDMRDDWFPDPLRFEDLLDDQHILDYFESSAGVETCKPAEQFNIPKPGFVLRYSLETSLYERVLFQGIADNLIGFYDPLLDDRVYSHRARSNDSRYLFQSPIDTWKAFNDDVRSELGAKGGVLLVTDIQNFYECITIDTLEASLLRLAPDSEPTVVPCIKFAKKLLQTWSPYKWFGIPQNRDASSFLANVFLQPIDDYMITHGYLYFRYMDDIRIICKDEYEARRALQDLITELRHLRLNVNAKKTFLLLPDDERLAEYLPSPNRLVEQIDSLYKSGKPSYVKKALPMLRDLAIREISINRTDSREFRFAAYRIINLMRCKEMTFDFTTVTKALVPLLLNAPWSSDMCTRYLTVAALSDRDIEGIVSILRDSNKNIYDWQAYRLWHLLGAKKVKLKELRTLARFNVENRAATPAKAAAISYLGACGTANDRAFLAKAFTWYEAPLVQRAIMVALQEASKQDLQKYVLPKLSPELQRQRSALASSSLAGEYFQPEYELSVKELFPDLPAMYVF